MGRPSRALRRDGSRAALVRFFATVTCLAQIMALGCGKSTKTAKEKPTGAALYAALSEIGSPVMASSLIASSVFRDCQMISKAALAVGERDWRAEEIRALVEQVVKRGRGFCTATSFRVLNFSRATPSQGTSLALSLLETAASQSLAALEHAGKSAALLRRRAELLFETGKPVQGREELIASLALENDSSVRARAARLLRLSGAPDRALALLGAAMKSSGEPSSLWTERVAALASLGRYESVVGEIAAADVSMREELARAAVGAAQDLVRLAKTARAGPVLLKEIAQSEKLGTTQKIGVLRRAVSLEMSDAELWIALGQVEEEAGNLENAITAWDRAAPLALGAQRPVLVPIRLLRSLGRSAEATARATRLAALGRYEKSSDSLFLASLAFRYAGRAPQSVSLAREALALDPGNGRLTSELAHRLEEAGRVSQAQQTLLTLLLCGSRGRPWHRHDLLARLASLGKGDVLSELEAASCQVVDADDLKALLATPTHKSDR